jgi:hypothetical protein
MCVCSKGMNPDRNPTYSADALIIDHPDTQEKGIRGLVQRYTFC